MSTTLIHTKQSDICVCLSLSSRGLMTYEDKGLAAYLLKPEFHNNNNNNNNDIIIPTIKNSVCSVMLWR